MLTGCGLGVIALEGSANVRAVDAIGQAVGPWSVVPVHLPIRTRRLAYGVWRMYGVWRLAVVWYNKAVHREGLLGATTPIWQWQPGASRGEMEYETERKEGELKSR